MDHKTILEAANKAISEGDHETFIHYNCEEVIWTFVGDQVLSGKDEVKKYIDETYIKPPKFNVEQMIAEGDYVTAIGIISLYEENEWIEYDYCDVWKFKNGKMCELKAFVIKK